MGYFKKIMSSLYRPMKNWNVEHRAQNLLEKQTKGQKPSVAPKHPTTAHQFQDFEREHPEYLKAQQEKNTKLHDMLEGIVVNPDRVGEVKSKSRPLPEHRGTVLEDDYGIEEPTDIPKGRFSLKQGLQFISNYQTDPVKYSRETIAKDYNLSQTDVDAVLKYFQMLQMQMPKDAKDTQHLEGFEAKKPTKSVESGTTEPMTKKS